MKVVHGLRCQAKKVACIRWPRVNRRAAVRTHHRHFANGINVSPTCLRMPKVRNYSRDTWRLLAAFTRIASISTLHVKDSNNSPKMLKLSKWCVPSTSKYFENMCEMKQNWTSISASFRFLRKSQLSISEDLRSRIKTGLTSDAKLDPHIFDHMQQDIVRIINGTTYPNFLQSDLYIQHIYNAEQSAAMHSASTTSSSGSCSAPNLPRSSTLPTLHEDTELSISDSMGQMAGSSGEKPHVRLTKNLLLATQERRLELRPQG